MCYKVRCDKCKLWTWGGCGRHIQQALNGIPKCDLCQCNSSSKK